MRIMKFLVGLVLLSAALVAPAYAASYNEGFSTNPPTNWSSVGTTWAATGGYYTNQTEPQNTVATYSGATWTSNVTMNVRMFSEHAASGNKVGAVFGYVDQNNYFRVLINMNDPSNPNPNNVILEKVTNGSAGTPIATGTVSGLQQNTWFDVQLVLSGTKLIVRVNNTIAIDNVTVSGLVAGRVGLITQWNYGRFDDLSVTPTATYTQSFGTTPTGWATNGASWSATTGYYANASDTANPALAYYGNTPLTSDFTYRVRALANYGGGSGNTVGAVFAYQTAGNYYEVVFNRAGHVELNKVTGGGTPQTLTSAEMCVPASTTCLPTGAYHNIDVVLNGMRVSVSIDNKLLIGNYLLSTLTAGYVGVLSRYNLGQFDDVQLVYPDAANLLFKSGYDNVMNIPAPTTCDTVKKETCFVFVNGTDQVTGYTWDAPYLWGGLARFQTTTGGGINSPSDVATYITNERVNITGPNGTPTTAFHQAIIAKPNPATVTPQDPLLIQGMDSNPHTDLYIRFWMKLQPNPTGTWRVLTQWKTGGDYRVSLSIEKDFWCTTSTPQFHWRLAGDNEANAGLPLDRKWEVRNMSVPVPVNGEWFKVEFFTHRSAGSDGRVWAAINGATVAEYQGSNKDTGEITRVMAHQLYTNGATPIEQWIDDLEIWDDAPADATPITAQTWDVCTNPPEPN